jgi:adenine-specific DNA-methyltransferase
MARLTEQERQEVVRYLEADKPLPEKYRFLLFADKREVELVWNGKTNEVCTIVLPFQTIEQVDEPRAEKAGDTALQMGLFDARGRQLKGWTNKLIWGDNKLILSSLKNGPMREEEKRRQIEEKEAAFVELILKAYRAEPVDNFACFHGKKAGRLVAVGPVNLPVTRLFVEEIILECRKKQITRVDILGFEFEMGLFPNVLDEARAKGIDIAPKYIPAEVFDKRAVEKNQVVFHDVAAIEVKPLIESGKRGKPATLAVELTDFAVFYSQDSIQQAEESLKNKGSKIVVEKGRIVKVSKDAKGVVRREALTRNWTDWIDYWAVDFNFESKREIIRVKDPDTGQWEEQWTGDYVFENEWQSFRTKKDRNLELVSVARECPPGRRKVAVKVVDIFGNDTMTIVEVTV